MARPVGSYAPRIREQCESIDDACRAVKAWPAEVLARAMAGKKEFREADLSLRVAAARILMEYRHSKLAAMAVAVQQTEPVQVSWLDAEDQPTSIDGEIPHCDA